MGATLPRHRPCPCSSGLRYGDCCAPLHAGTREAADAEALMRSRYSAFATREVAYLWRTLHPDHEDRALPEAQVVAAIRQSCDTHRYPGLAILDRQPPDASGIARVLFHARVFSRGKDVSFVELSRFAHDGKGWRYLDGAGRSAAEVGPCSGLTIAAFEARP